MKTKIKLLDFFEYTGIDYDEDIYSSGCVHYEYENYSISDIIHNLPKQFKLKEKQLEQCPELQETLTTILNTSNHDSLITACYDKQREMVEEAAEDIVRYVNKIKDNALNYIAIDWVAEEVTIDFNTKNALTATREIINCEGIFSYDTDQAFIDGYDDTNSPGVVVTQHIHYLLNIKLINSIYGFVGKPNYEWEVSEWSICSESVSDAFDELSTIEHDMLIGKIYFPVYLTICLQQRIKDAESILKILRKETYMSRKALKARELKQYQELESAKTLE